MNPPLPPAPSAAKVPAPRAPARTTGWSRRRVISAVAVTAGVLALLVLQPGPVVFIGLGFALISPLERLFRRHDYAVRRPGLRTDLLHILFTGVLQNVALVVGAVLVYIPLQFLTIDATATWIAGLPTWGQAVLGLFLFEVFGYWYHRASHEIGFLWRFHAVHHSSSQLDWAAAARLHPLEGFFGGLFIAPPLILLGFQPVEVAVFTAILGTWAVLIHANVNWRLRFLDGIWGTPEYHHWHHSNELHARNKNYSGLLPVLDLAFGTYYLPRDRRPAVYGIDDPMPESYLAQLAQPLRKNPPLDLTPF